MTQTEPLLGVYLKAINDTFDALSFSKLKKDKLDVDTFKDLVLEYAMMSLGNIKDYPEISRVSSASHCEIKIHDCIVAFFYGF
jgi:hypothetical protein